MRIRHIALAAGHHNADSGNAEEIGFTGRLCKAAAAELRARGFDVRVVQPKDGLGHVEGGVGDVGLQVAQWDAAGWPVDVFLEFHTQGVSNSRTRGLFVVYPDAPGDLDYDVRDRLGPDLAKRLSLATGIPVWAAGLLSEKESAVGLGGHRLGVFKTTFGIRAHCTRLLLEAGTHTSAADVAVMKGAAWPTKAAKAIADALVYFGGGTVAAPAGEPAAGPDPITRALDGIWHESEGLAAIEHVDRAIRIQQHAKALKAALGRP